MRLITTAKARTYKTASYADTARHSDDELILDAMAAHRETASSLFGSYVSRSWSDDLEYQVAVVTLHTD